MTASTPTTEVPEFNASLAALWHDLLGLYRIGGRWVGSQGEAEGRDFVVRRLRDVGLTDVRLESYPYLDYQPRGSALEILAPAGEMLPSEPVSYSANGEAEAEAVYVGEGRSADFEEAIRLGKPLEGKIAVVKVVGSERVFPADRYGAVGLVVLGDAPDGLIRNTTLSAFPPSLTPPFTGQAFPLPAVATSFAAGERLLKLLTLGSVRLRLRQEGVYSDGTGINVAARIVGSERPNEVVAIGAHYDTKFGVGGAVDNSGGLATLLELARFFGRQRPRRSIEFLAFTGEEIGLYGSWAYTRAHADEIRQHYLAMVNLDSISSALAAHYAVYAPRGWLSDLGVTIAKQLGWPVDAIVEMTPTQRNDGVTFLGLGVPAIRYTEYTPEFGSPYYHTKGDTIDIIDPGKWHRAVQVIGALTSYLANAEEVHK